jgi:ABC-type nickel/cobalt efflux system permease component RcnA
MITLPLAILAQADAAPAGVDYHLTAAGWVLMILSVGLVTGFVTWCISRVLRESSAKKLHSPSDVPPDVEREA